ncbi:MAG: ankyrin repeat domain-containing protein [Proteobacteria bacterium]|nr:ankyrin repeat domain-containing protein [Pseudomonadota bacterium]
MMRKLINSGFSNRSIVRQVLTALALTISSAIALAENPPLIEAARHQDAAAVRLVLASGADPDVSQSDGATALHWAVYQEDVDMLAALIQAGANVNITNRLGASPLYLAAKNGNAELIENLLRGGADPNLALPIGETPLMTAARSGTVEGVQQMLAAGADVNANEKTRGQTALMWAVAQGHVDVARALINAGANLEARSKVRPRLMYVEATNGYSFDPGIVEQLGGYSPLLFAAARGHVEVGQLLIRSEVDVNGVAGNGASPLVVATHSGHPDFARLLLSAGADPDAIGAGYNALHAAALRGDLETVEALLKYGADPDVRLKRPTPVQRASEDWALKTPLVSATPYWLAASFREAKIMSALEQGGANPLLTTEETFYKKGTSRADRLDPPEPKAVDGFASAVQAAIRGDSTRQRFNTIPNPDPVGEERLTLEAVIVAAEHGVNLNHFDFNESTALHYAAERNLPTVVRELAERGTDINALNGEGQTPLDVAIIMENTTDFFNFDLRPKPGPKPSEVLVEFGAVRSDIEGNP